MLLLSDLCYQCGVRAGRIVWRCVEIYKYGVGTGNMMLRVSVGFGYEYRVGNHIIL